MVNQDFQELKRQWGVNSSERTRIIREMRENLLTRNGTTKDTPLNTHSKELFYLY